MPPPALTSTPNISFKHTPIKCRPAPIKFRPSIKSIKYQKKKFLLKNINRQKSIKN